MKRQIDLDNTHYCDPQGILSLRKTIAKHLSETREIEATSDRIVVFPGAKPSIGLSQHTYCDPGDEIIRETLVTRGGIVVNRRVREFFSMPALES